MPGFCFIKLFLTHDRMILELYGCLVNMRKLKVAALTCREKDVLELLVLGCTNKKIAQQLRISNFTVRDHVSSLLLKYGVKNRMTLMLVSERLNGGM